MADVFISYKAEDRKRVQPLVDALERDGLSVWWDAHVAGASSWRSSIEAELDKAKCVIVIWTRRSVGPEGAFVRDEASRAMERGVYVPVKLDDVRPPLGFGETQALSLRGWKGDPADQRYRAISECVHQLLGRKKPRETIHAPRPAARIDRRTAIAGGAAAVAVAGTAGWLLLRPAGAKANTIAVLPFANLSGDPSQTYFSDGMAEEVRSALAALSGLEVVARTSSEMLRNADAITAARRLSVANVITGSVRRSPSTVRVSAQLVDGKNGLERWSQSFDRPFGDVLKIQSDIAANVARALSLRLGSGVVARSAGGTNNPHAQDFFLQATALEGGDSSGTMLRRIQLFDRAIEIDPNYAEAYARKGINQSLWANAWAASNTEKYRVDAEALRSARRAIAIAPSMALGYSALGLIYFNELRMKPALAALRRSVELHGADSLAFTNYSVILSRVRRKSEADSMIERALNLDPLNPVAWTLKAWNLFLARQYSQSIDAAGQALTLAPESRRARSLLAWDLLFLGRVDEAKRELQRIPADDYRRLVAEGAIAARSGHREEALRAIESLTKVYGETVNYQLAEIYGQLGDRDKAIGALEAAWATRDSGIGGIQVDPFLDPIRTDPRFAGIVTKVFG